MNLDSKIAWLAFVVLFPRQRWFVFLPERTSCRESCLLYRGNHTHLSRVHVTIDLRSDVDLPRPLPNLKLTDYKHTV